ncbi:glutaminyl-tRNA synthetase [Verticillium dahliae VdLs.17]|uniref:glutamine--tRNA ligase n=1 Tax=Verticillium dahliae (strain VdLs.17 / ATCC MYA-4575 / FGSC 10137) TaxID=498257 RepID=G2XDA2_VERDV|nr:glutaminyl-tRNA synthetase [Verticillium dahliae VdLs.17]EGY16970.1 glutaminyl-tRNA synthetase [Verticillium dahliae VdLs.17]KAF3347821.1 Vesicular-fusion protein sec18 [Verticillium dahliae VDG2]KAH6696157.1 glutaminyl-tRNA synthetase [Verticillium dahliae]
MADAITESTAKLQLDEETGEMVSKGELKKRQAKRAKKAAAAKAKEAKAAVASAAGADKKEAPKPAKKEEEAVIDPEAIFKQGFLEEVYKERPVKPVVTRFPPEPNGFLHIGHAKAIAVNFGFAKYHGGQCLLRYDDTNPEKEEEKYFTAIKDMVTWLGFTPAKITHSSDYFQQLYDLAEKMINLEKAYVCFCPDTEIKLQRGGEKGSSPRYRCKHAEQTVEDNLTKFRGMRDGQYQPKEAFLRMKQDITDNNPQMWDLAAYRIPKEQEHFRTGNQWKIYPTYDFTHCLVDSMENISHSLCTREFLLSRQSYEWLNAALVEHQPMQREYGRLNIAGTVLSKRKIQKLVEEKFVRNWDDPRLFTLVAVKRRGVPPAAILQFVNELGVTTAETLIQIKRFEQSIRKYLEATVPRLMMVLDPIPVVIEDATESIELDLPFSPKDPKMGSHTVKFTSTIYIDRSDFREVDSKDYFRLAPGKTVGLMNAPHPIKATSFTKDEATGKITEVRAVFDKEAKKPKAYITWVGSEGSRRVEARVHNSLFKSDKPEDAEGGFLNDINPDSEVIYPEAMIESGFDEVRRRAPWPEAAGESELGKGGPESVRFQAMRIAYFAMDSDSTDDKIVLNRIVSLKEDAGKN